MSVQLQKVRPLVQAVDTALSQQNIELAKTLHPRLLRFFEKYPPSQYIGKQYPPKNSRDNRRPPRQSTPLEIFHEVQAARDEAVRHIQQKQAQLTQRRVAPKQDEASAATRDQTAELIEDEAEEFTSPSSAALTSAEADTAVLHTPHPSLAQLFDHLSDLRVLVDDQLPSDSQERIVRSRQLLDAATDTLQEAHSLMTELPVLAQAPTTVSNTITPTPAQNAPEEPPQTETYTYNPFLPVKNFRNGTWTGPLYSLRRQAELCKLARRYGVEDWLPWSRKLSWVKDERRFERGLRMKGTGEGQRVKGHKWERMLPQRIERRTQAMLDMPRLINEWKEKGHGRKLEAKKYPSGRAMK